MYWTRFQTAQMWGQIVMKDLVGGPIAAAKLNQASAPAVAACDAMDGVTDGVIDDPRLCKFSATAEHPRLGHRAGGQLPERQRGDGDRHDLGRPAQPGRQQGLVRPRPRHVAHRADGTTPFALGVTQFHWDVHDRNFDWHTVPINGYASVAQSGSRNIADVTDTFGDLDGYRATGGKLLTWVGGNDQLIFPQGVIHYYREMAERYGSGPEDFSGVQQFYRLFRAPGNGHCGGGAAPQIQDPFGVLVNWVEKGVAPNSIPAATTVGGVTRTRPLCPYPQTAIYNGSGSTDDAANFHCGGNLDTQEILCESSLVKYKEEVAGPIDYRANGTTRGACRQGAPQ